jgi:hypothetical protein
MSNSRLAVLSFAIALLAGMPEAQADLSKKVISAFKAKLVITAEPIEAAADDKATIALIKKKSLTEVKGEPNSEDAQEWRFQYTAFLSSSGYTTMALEFYDGKKFVADRHLEGIDAAMTVLSGEITISEDDGPAKGKSYVLKMVGKKGNKDVVLATASPVKLN